MKKSSTLGAMSEIGFKLYAVRSAAYLATVQVAKTWLKRSAATLAILALSFSSFVAPVYANHDPFNGVPQTSVQLCHSGNGKNFVSNSPSITATGGNVNLAGHEGHPNDIIPPFHYDDNGTIISYPGKNWTATNQDIWDTGTCTGDGIINPTTGSIVVNKVANGGNATFNFSVSGGPTSVANFSITTTANAGSQTLSNLLPGTYAISETLPANWSLTTNGCASVVVVAGQQATCTVTNLFVAPPTTGGLTVTKNTVGANGTFSFTGSGSIGAFQLTTSGNTASQTFSNLTPGSFTITEGALPTSPNGTWAKTGDTCQGVAVAAGQTATCVITNTFTPNPPGPTTGSLTVTKNTVGANGTFNFTGSGSIGAFSLTTTANTNSQTFTNLTPGSFTITEGALPTDPNGTWSKTGDTCQGVTVAAGQTATCVITNTFTPNPSPDTGTLTLIKQVSGGSELATAWTLSAAGPTPLSGTTPVSGTVNVGNYDLSETGPTGYTASAWSCMLTTDSVPVSVQMVDPDTVLVAKNQNITCTITNTFNQTPLFSLSGKVYHDNNTQNGEFDVEAENGLENWTVYIDENGNNSLDGEEISTLSDANGDYIIEGLVAGCYTVREVLQSGWNQTDPTIADDGVLEDYEYVASVGFAICSEDSILDRIVSFFIPTANAQVANGNATGLNFGNIEQPRSGGGGSGSRRNDDSGQILGDSTSIPYVAPQVLGATTLPVTGSSVPLNLLAVALISVAIILPTNRLRLKLLNSK